MERGFLSSPEELIDEAGSGVAAAHSSRGCAFGDFDNDGDVDVLVWNMNEPPSLLRNDVSSGGHWLKVRLVGVQTNRSAIGSRVTVRYGDRLQAQEVTAQASFLSANDKRLHFGLGNSTSPEVTVHWTNGNIERIGKVPADCLLRHFVHLLRLPRRYPRGAGAPAAHRGWS